MPLKDLLVTPQIFLLQLSSGWDQPMGSLVVTVKQLLAEPQLVLDQWFHLDGATPESQILLRAELKVRTQPNHVDSGAMAVSDTCSCSVFVLNRF